MVEPHSSNFKVITTNFLGVRIFRKFTVLVYQIPEFSSFFHSPQRRMIQQIRSPRDVVDTQLVTLQSKNDSLNEELAAMIKTETELREGLRNSDGDISKQVSAEEQLSALLIRKKELLKRISAIESDISVKEKELKSKR